MTDIRCPMCGKPNPEDLEECQHCGARLKPLLAATPPEDAPSPVPPDPSEPADVGEPDWDEEAWDEEDSGDWLGDLREEVDQGTDELSLTGALDPTRLEGPPEREPPEPDVEGTPEWLRRLREKRAAQTETPEPDQESPPPPAEPPLPDTQPETPDWLGQFRAEDEPDADELPEPSRRAAKSLKERLAAIERDDERRETPPPEPRPVEPPPSEIDEVPAEALETIPGMAARPAPETPEEEAGLPDWLSDLEPEAPLEAPEEGLETKDIPGMSFQDQDASPEEGDMPEWLRGLRPEEEPPSGDPPEEPPSEAPPEEPPVDIPSEAFETKDIPELGFQPGEETPEPADLPEWLRGLAPEDELPAAPTPDTPAEEPARDEAPDWLPEPTEEGEEPPAEALETREIPDLAFQDREAVPAEAVPEWLQGLEPEEPAEVPEPITPGMPPEPPSEIDEPEPAAWPPEPGREEVPSEALETREVPGFSFKDEAEVPAPEAAEDLPDWLQDVQREAPEAAFPEEPLVDGVEPGEISDFTFEEPEDADEVPEWLRGLEAEAAAAAAAAAPEPPEAPEQPLITGEPPAEEHEDILPELDVGPPEGEVPEWLEAAAAAVPSSGPLKLPDEEEIEPEPPEAEAEPAEELPDWLQDAGPPPEGEAVPDLDALPEMPPIEPEIAEEAVALEDEIPPWMIEAEREAAPPQPEIEAVPEEEEGIEPPVEAEPEPAWLQATEADREPPVSLEQEDLPDWLQGLQAAQEEAIPAPEMLEEPESPIDVEAAEPAEEVPPWLAELRAKTTEVPGVDEIEAPEGPADLPLQVGVEPQMEGIESGELPDWISEMSPERAGQVEIEGEGEAEAEAEIEGEEERVDLEPAELPGWLKAMRPIEAVTPLAPSEEAARGVEGVGPLAGLEGILPAEPEITQAGTPPSFSMRVEVTQNQYEHIEKLKTLLEEEAESQAVGPRWGVVQPQHVLRWIILGILLLAVGIPLAFGFQQNDLPTLVPEETLEVGNLVLGLPLNGRVLVSFDYEPGLSAEMDAAAEAVIDHMIRLRQARLVMVSTSTTGPALAERFLVNPLGAGRHTFIHGDNYINLGYIPGGAAGLIDFATTPRRVLPIPFNLQGIPEANGVWTLPLLADVGTVAEFDLVVVIVDDASTARAWIEQVEPQLEGVPLVMVSSAQAAPLIRPYYITEPRQVDGLISGLPGAVGYLRINNEANMARPYWDAFGNGLLITALLIVAGGFISGSANVLQRTQPGSIEGSP